MLKGKNYCITRENVIAHEIVGLNAVVLKSPDKNKQGMQGKITDETKNLLLMETKQGEKKMPKKECVFEFALGKEKAIVQGNSILEKPENRTKNFWRKKNAM